MSASDALVRQDSGSLSAETLLADTAAFTTCSIVSGQINADMVRVGVATITAPATTIVVANPSITANSRIFLQLLDTDATTTRVWPTNQAGVSFTINADAAPTAPSIECIWFIAKY